MAEVNIRYLIEAVARIQGLRQATREMTQAEKTARQLARTMSSSSRLIGINTTTAFSRTQGEFQKTTATFVDGGKKITTTFTGMGASAVPLRQSISSVNKAMGAGVPIVGQFQKALARVAIVVPIWFLFRQTIAGVFRTLRDGTKDIVEFDRALQKARRNLQGSSDVIARNFKNLKEEVTALSRETGVSVQKITVAFQRFATTGLDFETSMAGATASVKTAILLFGETEEVANAVARAYRVLGGRTDEFTSKGEELKNFLSLVAELWKDNAFEVNEFAGAFERFAPTARASNVSLRETAVLLATLQTAGIRGTRAGRLLSTAILQMEKNFDKFNKTLGISLATEDTTFGRLRLITRAIEELNKTNPVEASKAVSSLFRIRGGQSIRALTALNSELEKAIQKTGDLVRSEEEFRDVNSQITQLAKRFTNLNKEIGRAVVTGIVGGEDFRDSLEDVVEVQERAVGGAENFFRGFSAGLNLFVLRLPTAMKDFFDLFTIHTRRAREETDDFYSTLAQGIRGELDINQLTEALDELRKATGQVPRELSKVDRILGKVTFKLDIPDAEARQLESLLVKQLKKLREKARETPVNVPVVPRVQDVELELEEEQKIAQAILKVELSRLKAHGALNSQLIKAESTYAKQLGIIEDDIKILERQLKLEEEINAERRLRSTPSSESVKLFRIAQSEGIEVARRIGQALSGEIDFEMFIRRGGEAVEVFKRDFGSIFEQQQAIRFFRGETVPELRGLRGGARIPIREEETLQRTFTSFSASISLTQKKLLEQLQRAKFESQNVGNQTVQELRAGTLRVESFAPGAIGGALSNADINRMRNIQNVGQRVAPSTTVTLGDINISVQETTGLTTSEIDQLVAEKQAQQRADLIDKLQKKGTRERNAVEDVFNRE